MLTPRIVRSDGLLEAIEAFLSESSASWEGQSTLVVLQDSLQGSLSTDDWALYLELESISNERSARLQEVLVRWAFDQGMRFAGSKAHNGQSR
jgi:hypothetical protein